MPNLSELKQAIRNGNTERVEEIADELVEMEVDISSALELAKNMNRIGKSRGKWGDIVEILESYFEDDDE